MKKKLKFLLILIIILSIPLILSQEFTPVNPKPPSFSLDSLVFSLKKMGMLTLIIGGGLIILFLIGGVIWFKRYQKKKWFLKVILKMPRNNGKTINTEIAKGYWDARKATLWVRRENKKKFFVKLDDIRKYLQGNEVIELEGSGVDWKPILFESYLELIDEKTGQKASIMNYSMDFSTDSNWAIASEREFINTFSLSDAIQKFGQYIAMGIMVAIVILAEVISYILKK